MKKTFMWFVCSALLSIAFAQKGTMLIGGDLNYASQKTNFESGSGTYSSSAFSFNPFVGYQFTSNLTGGTIFSITSNGTENNGNQDKQNVFSAGPFLRYSKSLSGLFIVYGQLQATFGSGKTTHSGNFSEETKFSYADISFFPAVFINVKKGFGLNFNIGGIEYNYTKQDGYGNQKVFAITIGQTFSVGISKNF